MGNAQGIGKKEIEALTQSTNWTAEDLKGLHGEFLQTPSGKSGELDVKSFILLMKPRVPMDETGYRTLFHQMDADGSGTISFNELATNLSVIGKGTVEEKLSFTFDLYDEDKSGHLDKHEAQKVLEQMKRVAATLGRTADDFIAGMIDKLDVDKDGTKRTCCFLF